MRRALGTTLPCDAVPRGSRVTPPNPPTKPTHPHSPTHVCFTYGWRGPTFSTPSCILLDVIAKGPISGPLEYNAKLPYEAMRPSSVCLCAFWVRDLSRSSTSVSCCRFALLVRWVVSGPIPGYTEGCALDRSIAIIL